MHAGGREIEVKSSNEASSIDLKNGEISVKVTTPCCIPNDDCYNDEGQLGHSECLTNKRCYLSSDCSGWPSCPPC